MSTKATTILIVEDSPVQAELLRRALEGAGYGVIAAGDGAEGLALARENPPAAVVSDINMPIMDGYAFCAAIRSEETLKTTPVILLTMLSDPADVIRGLNAGADAYLTKPYNIPTLVSRVESLLAFPPPAPPPVERRKVQVRLAGETHLVDAHGPRILNLLVSTYENAVLQNRELLATQQALEDLNQHLEKKVLEKTAELRRSEQRFRALIENGSDLVLVIDARGIVTFASPSVRRIGGYEPDELLGMSIAGFIHPDDMPAAMADLSALVQNPGGLHVAELRYRRKDGTWVILETVARSAIDDPSVAGVVVNARDVTERKESEQALRESEEKLRTISSSAQDGIVMADNDGLIEFWNPSAERLFGYTVEEVTGKPLHELIVPERLHESARSGFETFRATGQGPIIGKTLELPSQRKDGTEFVAEHSISAVNLKGKWHAVALVRDITARKRAEEDLRRLNWALRALGQSNSALVHAGTETELFRVCCDAIAGTEGYPLAWIGLSRDDPARSVEVVAAAGEAIGFMAGFEVSWGDLPHGAGPTGTAIRTGATQVVKDLAESSAYRPWIERARAHGLASSISLPIRADGKAMGALSVYSSEVDAFGQPEVDLFEELAEDIGYGIASRRTRSERDKLQQDQLLGVERLKSALIGTIGAVALTVEKRDPYTAGHQQRVAELCVAIGRMLGLSEDRLEGLRLGATIHDIGKVSVPAEILSRPGKLSPLEFEIIKSHPQIGYEIVKDVKFPWPVQDMIHQHHERLNGSGYPQGLKGEQIILEARILAVADVVEAMSSHRPYRPGLGLDAALAQVRADAGTKLDARVVDACERVFREQGFSFAND